MPATLVVVGRQGARVRTTLDALLSSDRRERVRETTYQWIKRLRLVPYDGVPMRERFAYRGDSLWWFTELYLHKMRRLEAAVAALAALETACERHDPARLELDASDAAVVAAARAFGTATGLPLEVSGPASAPGHEWEGFLVGASAMLSRLRPAPPRPHRRRARVAAFVHTAFARASSSAATPADEHYIGPVLAAIAAQAGDDALTCVGVGPRRNFRARRWWDPLVRAGGPIVTPIERLAPRRTLAGALDLWRRRDDLARQITTAPGLREAAILERYDLWPVLGEQLALAARVQWPWSARAMDEAAAALDALAPDVVVTYAEAGGWGRALVLEARRRAIPSAGLQHGFIYRHWLNYRHEPDEMEARADDGGFPRPDRTLLFDGYAAAFLEGAGHFPPGSLAVTGSARLDALSTHVRALSADRDALRRALGVRAEEKLLVLAAKFSEIEREIPALFTAVAARPGTRLIVKPHPAETPALYAPLAAGTGAVTVADAAADLGRLLAAADAIVTMNSTVAIDGLVLGIPALVLGAATNLAPFVEAGVMLGATGDAVRPSLETLLYDLEARARLTERAAAFAAAHEMRADGGAAGRSAADILVLAAR